MVAQPLEVLPISTAALNIPGRFAQGLTWEQFLDSFTVERNRERILDVQARFALTADEAAFFRRLAPLDLRVLVIAADWCPDVYQHLPILIHAAAEARFTVRIFDRDTNLDLMNAYLSWDQKMRIPEFIFFDRDWREVGRWIERSRLADRMLEEGRAQLPPRDDPDWTLKNRELSYFMGQEYRKGYLYREAVREIQELLAPLLAP